MITRTVRIAALLSLAVAVSAPSLARSKLNDAQAVARYRQAERIGQDRLKRFDTLDFDVYTNQKWGRLKLSSPHRVVRVDC